MVDDSDKGARDDGCWRAVGAGRRKMREPAMGARQSTYRTRDLTQAIVGIRRAVLGICRVEIDRTKSHTRVVRTAVLGSSKIDQTNLLSNGSD
jgi:hypothetical protein